MAWSYDPALPADSDKVRFYVGDTDITNQLVQDEGVTAMLTLYGDVLAAAAAVADGLASFYGRKPTITIAGISYKGVDRADYYTKLAARLRRISADAEPGAMGMPFVGGVSIAAEQVQFNNTDRNPNRFVVGQNDFPGTTTPSLPISLDDDLP